MMDPGKGRAECAKALFEQQVLVWEDHVGNAETIHNKRRTFMVGLVVLAGLGLFKFELYRPSTHDPVLALWAMVAIKVIVGLVFLAAFISAVALMTERGICGARGPTGRAVKVAQIGAGDFRRIIDEADETEAWLLKTQRLRTACDLLAERNRAVRKRIKTGLFVMCIAYLLVLAAYIVYACGTVEGAGT